MARRLVGSVRADAPGEYAATAQMGESCKDLVTRAYATNLPAGQEASLRAVVEHSTDYDPRTQGGAWTAVGATRTQSAGRAGEAETRVLAELARLRGGWVRLKMDVVTLPAGAYATCELWADTNVWEGANDVPVALRARPQDTDATIDLAQAPLT